MTARPQFAPAELADLAHAAFSLGLKQTGETILDAAYDAAMQLPCRNLDAEFAEIRNATHEAERLASLTATQRLLLNMIKVTILNLIMISQPFVYSKNFSLLRPNLAVAHASPLPIAIAPPAIRILQPVRHVGLIQPVNRRMDAAEARRRRLAHRELDRLIQTTSRAAIDRSHALLQRIGSTQSVAMSLG